MKRKTISSLTFAISIGVAFWCLSVSTVAAQSSDDVLQLPEQLDHFLAQIPQSKRPLAGSGKDFVQWGTEYGVNPRLVVAISGAESSFGAHICTDSNAWNWFWEGPCPKSPFASWDAGIKTVSHFLHKSYLLKGYNTIPLIGAKYCVEGCEHWIPGVTLFYKELGGDESNLAWQAASNSGSAPASTPTRQTIVAKITSTSMVAGHWWQRTSSGVTLSIEASVHGGVPLARSVKLVRISPQGPESVATLHPEGTDENGDMSFSGEASLPELPPGELKLQVTAGFPKAMTHSILVSSNLITMTVVSPPSSMPVVLVVAGSMAAILGLLLLVVLVSKKTKAKADHVEHGVAA